MRKMKELALSESARVVGMSCRGALLRRFLDLGIYSGAKVVKISKSPLGDPSCYMISGIAVAIRDVDAASVFIE